MNEKNMTFEENMTRLEQIVHLVIPGRHCIGADLWKTVGRC